MYLSSVYCFHSHSCLVWKDHSGCWNYARRVRENGNLVQKHLHDIVNFGTVLNNQLYLYTKHVHFIYTKYGQQGGWRLQPSSWSVWIISQYEDTPETTVWELPSKWNPSGKKNREGKEKGNKFIERRVEKKKPLGLRYFSRAQRAVKENKTGPGSGFPCW